MPYSHIIRGPLDILNIVPSCIKSFLSTARPASCLVRTESKQLAPLASWDTIHAKAVAETA